MIKVLKSRLFIGGICLVLAAGIAFGLLPKVYSAKLDTVEVIKLRHNVSGGTVIDDSMLTRVEVGAYNFPETVVREVNGVAGMVAKENMYAGEFVSKERLVTQEEYNAIMEEQTKGLTEGLCLVTIQFPTASSGGASILRAGDIVDVYETSEDTEGALYVDKVLESMYIYDVLNSNLESLHELDDKKAELLIEEDADFNFEPAYVVFRCSEDEAEAMIRMEKAKSFHLALSSKEE